MRNTIWILMLSNALTSSSHAKPVQELGLSLGGTRIGTSTLQDVQAVFGRASPKRGAEEESPIQLCYFHDSKNGKAFVVFESGPLGGFKRITGIRLAALPPRGSCARTSINLFALKFGNQVALLQGPAKVFQASGRTFKRSGETWVYEKESQRKATADELIKLRANWPGEKQDYFDVYVRIEARFHKERLVDYHVSKVESF